MPAIFDLRFSPFTREALFGEVERRIAGGEPGYVVTPNLDFARLAARTPEFRAALDGAAISLCDGKVLYFLLKLKGDAVPEKLSGSDLTPALLEFAETRGYRVFLFGSDEETLRGVARRYPKAVAGWEAPPFRPRLWEEDALNREYVEKIRASGADMVFVALGAMKQEYWARKFHRDYGAPLTFCIGASLDFLSERVRRSPRFLSAVGLEWAWRLAMEPRRLWRRYVGDAVFLVTNLRRAFTAK